MVRSITSQPASFARLNACEGEISWSMRITLTPCCSRMARSSSRLPVPKYAAESNPARFCVNQLEVAHAGQVHGCHDGTPAVRGGFLRHGAPSLRQTLASQGCCARGRPGGR
jgi:hypothetical protein